MKNQHRPVKVSTLPTCQLQLSSLKQHLVYLPEKSPKNIWRRGKTCTSANRNFLLGLFLLVFKLHFKFFHCLRSLRKEILKKKKKGIQACSKTHQKLQKSSECHFSWDLCTKLNANALKITGKIFKVEWDVTTNNLLFRTNMDIFKYSNKELSAWHTDCSKWFLHLWKAGWYWLSPDCKFVFNTFLFLRGEFFISNTKMSDLI